MSIDRRRFLAGSSAAVIALSARSMREAHAHGSIEGQRPWSAAPERKSADVRMRALAYAVLAPSAFNLQPWLVQLPGADTIVIRCDLASRLPAVDREDRMTVIGFGAFLELLRMAAAAEGYRADTTAFPDGEPMPNLDDRPIARVRFVRGGASPDPLFAQALDRRTSKRPFERRSVATPLLEQLRTAAAEPARSGVTNDANLVARLSSIAADAFAIEKATPRVNLEQVRVTRLGDEQIAASPDGIAMGGPDDAAALRSGQLSRAALTDPGSTASRTEVDKYRSLCDTAQAYVWLASPSNGRSDQLAAGRDWLRIHLMATELGLAFEPQSPALNEYPEMKAPLRAIREALKIPFGQHVQMLARLGYAAQMPPTPRWPAETKVLS